MSTFVKGMTFWASIPIISISAVSDTHDYGLDIPGNVIDEMYDIYGILVWNLGVIMRFNS